MDWVKDVGVAFGLGFAGVLVGIWALPCSVGITVAYATTPTRPSTIFNGGDAGDYVWLVESVLLGTGAAMLIFNGMPLLGATVAFVACLEDADPSIDYL
jgi:hypothetical protein